MNKDWTRLVEYLKSIGFNQRFAEKEARRCKQENVNVNWKVVLKSED